MQDKQLAKSKAVIIDHLRLCHLNIVDIVVTVTFLAHLVHKAHSKSNLVELCGQEV